MKYLKKFNELFTYNTDDDINGKNFILYQENLWIFNDEDYVKYEKEICDKLGLNGDHINFWDLENSIKDNRIDVIIGYIHKNTAHITSNDFRHSEHSPDIKKLEKEFKKFNKDIKIVFDHTDDWGDTNEIPYNIDKTKLKDRVFYHGTSIMYLEEILKTGIRPTKSSNFNIKNYGKIFFTLNIEKAYFHAMHTYEKHLNSSSTMNFPIIIEFNVPNVDKLIPDYDLAIDVYGFQSDEIRKYNYHKTKFNYSDGSGYDGSSIENKIGVFGYEGRIPASFIKSIHIDKEAFASYYVEYEYGFETEDIKFEDFLDWQEYSPNNIKDLYEYAQDVLNGEYGYDDEDEDE